MTAPRPNRFAQANTPPASAQLTAKQTAALACAQAAHAAGLSGGDLITAVAIAGAETGGTWNPAAHCLNCAGVTEDSRGAWQINVDAHPEYASANLYDLNTCAQAMVKLSTTRSGKRSWTPWSTYVSGLYLSYWSAAKDAAALTGAGDQGTAYSSQDAQAGLRAEIEAQVAAGKMTRAEADKAEANLPASAAGVAVPQGITGGAATGIVHSIAHASLGIGEFLALLANPHTWLRVVYVLGGLVLVVMAAFLLDRSLMQQVAGTAVTNAAGAIARAAV